MSSLICTYRSSFQEILITSSFMTPIESKNSTNINRVRCFAANALVESVAKEKWELVKVTCTQPFNRHVQYGLSFITLHVAGDKTSDDEANQSKNVADKVDSSQLGPLQLREDSPDSESESSSSLFSRWKQSRTNPLSGNNTEPPSQAKCSPIIFLLQLRRLSALLPVL